MNKRILIIGALSLLCASHTILAQQSVSEKDTTYTRQVLLEREYNPTLQDANKVNTTPSIYAPLVKKQAPTIARWTTSTVNIQPTTMRLDAGSFGSFIAHNEDRGYAGLYIGNYNTVEAQAGISIINNEYTTWDVWGNYSRNKGIPSQDYPFISNEAKHNDWSLKSRWTQAFKLFHLNTNLSIGNQSFNYYGGYQSSSLSSNPYINMDQSVFKFDIDATATSYSNRDIRYEVSLGYNHLNFKESLTPSVRGPKVGNIRLNTHFYSQLESDATVGLHFGVTNQQARQNITPLPTFTHLKAAPYIRFDKDSWAVSLGANANIVFDEDDKILLSPYVDALWNFHPQAKLYLQAKGYVSENTYADILVENRYARPTERIFSSRTYLDGNIGVAFEIVKGVEVDIFAGYKRTHNEHFYRIDSLNSANAVLYGDLRTLKFGGVVKTLLIPYTNLSAKIEAFSYDVEYNSLPSVTTAFGKPKYVASVNADVFPMDNLTIGLNYLLQGEQTTLSPLGQEVDMGSINEMNIDASYRFTPKITGKVAVNNVLSHKNQLYPGYYYLGTNFVVGASFKF